MREDEKGQRSYTRKFEVITSGLADAYSVKQATGIPRRGDVLLTDTDARVKSVAPEQNDDNPYLWIVTVEYDTTTNPEQEENPLDRPAEVTWSFTQFQRIAEKDVNGEALLNSAGYYFDPPPEIDDSRPVLTITRNEPAFNASQAIDYQDAVNSDSFLGFEPYQAKVANITATRQFEKVWYWKVTYEFHFRREQWTLEILDQGRWRAGRKAIRQKNEAGTEIPGTHVTDPVPLDGNGEPLADPTPDNAVFLPFDVYKEREFSAFNF